MIRPSTIYCLLILSLSGCSSIRSQFDDLHLVYTSGQNEISKTPDSFVVSIDEITSLISPQKNGFRVYADHEAYYVREEVDAIGLKTISKTNSEHAKEYGLRISGTTREEFDFLRKFQTEHPLSTIDALSKQLLLLYVGR